MKTVILAGGKGTRLREYTEDMPKALVAIGGKPIIWHIMKIYASRGFTDFVVCAGYFREQLEDYFAKNKTGGWNVEIADTGLDSTKAERIRRVEKFLQGDENFFLAYGDDVSDVDVRKVLDFHLKAKKTATLTTVNPESQFGIMKYDAKSGIVKEFIEKPKLNQWINGGFFVFNKKIFGYLKKVPGELESEVFGALVKDKELVAYRHAGFWKCMNTFKEWSELNELWQKGGAPWKKW